MKEEGKTREVFITDDGKGGVTTYGGWNKVLSYLDIHSKSMRTTLQAVKVEENAKFRQLNLWSLPVTNCGCII